MLNLKSCVISNAYVLAMSIEINSFSHLGVVLLCCMNSSLISLQKSETGPSMQGHNSTLPLLTNGRLSLHPEIAMLYLSTRSCSWQFHGVKIVRLVFFIKICNFSCTKQNEMVNYYNNFIWMKMREIKSGTCTIGEQNHFSSQGILAIVLGLG